MYARKFHNIIRRYHYYITRNVFCHVSMHVNNYDTMSLNITRYLLPLFGKINRCLSNKQLKFCCEVEEAINKQIHTEQQAAQDYLCIAVLFLQLNISRPGAGGYFMKMYLEELNHMQKLIQYQIMRGGMPVISGIKEPSRLENITLLSAFEQAFIIEDNVTKGHQTYIWVSCDSLWYLEAGMMTEISILLENLVSIADSVKDYQCSDFVTSVFLGEQRLALSELAHHITKLSRFADDEYALYQYDLHLANNLNTNKLESN